MTCSSVWVATLSQTFYENSQWHICGERAQEQDKHEVTLHQYIPLLFWATEDVFAFRRPSWTHLSYHFWTQAYLKAWLPPYGNEFPRTMFFLVRFPPATWSVSSEAPPILALWESAVTSSLATFSMSPRISQSSHVLFTIMFFPASRRPG